MSYKNTESWLCNGFGDRFAVEINRAKLKNELMDHPDLPNMLTDATNELYALIGATPEISSMVFEVYEGKARLLIRFEAVRAEYDDLLFDNCIDISHNAKSIYVDKEVTVGGILARSEMRAQVPEADRQFLRANGNLGIGYSSPTESVQCNV